RTVRWVRVVAVPLLVLDRFSRVVGRDVRLAAAAFGAGVGVEAFLPGEICQFRDPELLAVFQIELRELTLRGKPLEEDGGKPGDDVEVLSEREEVEDGYDDRDVEQDARGHHVGRGLQRD